MEKAKESLDKFQEIIKQHSELKYDVKRFIMEKVKVPFRTNGPLITPQLFYNQNLVLDDINMFQKNIFIQHRQAGIMSIASLFALHTLVYTDKTVLIFAPTHKRAEDLLAHIHCLMETLDWPLYQKSPIKNSKNKKTYVNGGRLICQTINKYSPVGISADLILIEDFLHANTSDLVPFFACLQGSKNPGCKFILSSSPSNKNEDFLNQLILDPSWNYRFVKWFMDERFNKDLRWEKDIHSKNSRDLFDCKFKDDVDYTDLHNVKDAMKLLHAGYTPKSSWTEAHLRDQMSRTPEIENLILASKYYRMQNREDVLAGLL